MIQTISDLGATVAPIMVFIVGRIASGKSTTAQELAKRLRGVTISFGSAVVQIATENGSPTTRFELQTLGQSLVDNNPDELIDRTFEHTDMHDPSPRFVIIDGLRHVAILERIVERFVNWSTTVVYLDLPVDECIKRAEHKGITASEYLEFATHETESEVHQELRNNSDVIVDASLSTQEITRQIVDFMSGTKD